MEPPVLPVSRPRSLTAFGVINTAFGTFALFGIVASVRILLSPAEHAANPVFQVMERDAVYALFYKVMFIPGILGVLAQLASGIGLIKSREWARKLTILWAGYIFLTTPVTTWMLQTHVNPAMIDQMTKSAHDATTANIMKTVMLTMTIITAVLTCAFSVFQIWMLARTKVRVYCQGQR